MIIMTSPALHSSDDDETDNEDMLDFSPDEYDPNCDSGKDR